MYISKVKISNYRGLRSCEFDASSFACIIGENNAGKSSILLATSLFFTASHVSEADFYDPAKPIIIELTFSDVTSGHFWRVAEEHRGRLNELIKDNTLALARQYQPGSGRPDELLCKKLCPKDDRFEKTNINVKGRNGKQLESIFVDLFPEYENQFSGVTTQKAAFEILEGLIKALPEDMLEYRWAPINIGIDRGAFPLLPEPIYIPAVKDLKDDVKTKESTTFGKLLGLLAKFIEESEDIHDIINSFERLHAFLNKQDNGADARLPILIDIERLISRFLQENFPRISLQLEIPKPELKQIFSNAKILVDDGVKGTVDTKGDGLKRSIVFALLRTFVEQSKIQRAAKKNVIAFEEVLISNDEVVEHMTAIVEERLDQPYIFLFEEPELYLHPNAQMILFEALQKLASIGNQIFVTTHSPVFFSPQSTGTFIKITKEYPPLEKPFGKVLAVNINDMAEKDAFQIICYENNAAVFFSNTVLLVEGDSDVIFIKEVAKMLNEDWNFDLKNIPIISINGKTNVQRFINFFTKFNIKVYCLVDSDAVIDGFEKFAVSENIQRKRSALIQCLDNVANQLSITSNINVKKAKSVLQRTSALENYNSLLNYARLVREGVQLSDEQLSDLDNFSFFIEEENSIRRQVFTCSGIIMDEKFELLQELYRENIFILNKGAIESYYPAGVEGRDKPGRALHAIKLISETADGTAYLPKTRIKIILEEKEIWEETCELSMFFKKIFS